ncbi:tyrosine-type recombinase/integrase [Rubinisphaera brasiliensis]|uniref:Integrase family protein n=1 Tax=Rubinisphaera brasiliensis (strain ATCC 49424 / DSM 5305 / JCM 21570 / IAM 15109 / NBRC 103401 / IFAM 1448) TaxID=756272 RepID=F0SQ64_RUBBR|nr:tyrosine-type recombinase/integrase [Rubinisphaera brasiliensis]ADY61241.1 integrase family protein [Rubinisphaera brasiliensis DSM 5305]
MASISKRGGGQWRLQFLDGNVRKGINLGKLTKSQASHAKRMIESLIASKLSGLPMDAETARWVPTIDQTLHARIAEAGLLERRDHRDTRLGTYIDEFIRNRTDVKESTRTTWNRARNHLVSYFGESRDLRSITTGEAQDFYRRLQRDLADNTARRTAGICRQIFTDALDREIITKNVFASKKIPITTRGNDKRQFFIERDVAEKILNACPNDEWRLIFALSRFGGLRCPSEHLALRWEHVDLDARRLTVPSPKTAHHDGKESRVIPIFPEIEKPLLAVSMNAPEGNPWIITSYRESSQNLRTQFKRILQRAGVAPWPKLFQNLRSTRETELIKEGHNPYTVCEIIGNSLRVMEEHYLQNRDSELDQMLPEPSESGAYWVQRDGAGCSVVQNVLNAENTKTA